MEFAAESGGQAPHSDPLFSDRCPTDIGRQLELAGITGTILWEQWGVILWNMRLKENRIKLKLEAHRPVDEIAFQAWLKERLGTNQDISIKWCPRSKCCGSQCTGCLIGTPNIAGFP
jgi:hypothetical protein